MTDKQTVKFGDICREVKLTTKDPIADGYERYIGLEHLDSGSLKIKRWGMIAEDNPSFTRVFNKGHILFGKRRPYLKKAAIAEFDGICSGDIIVMEPNDNFDFPMLLPYLVQSETMWNAAISTSSGSLSPRTKFKDLSNTTFTFQSSKEFKRNISNVLRKFEILSSKLEDIEMSLKLLDYRLIEEKFSKHDEVVVLSSLCSVTSSKRIMRSEYVEKGVPFLRSKEIIELGKSLPIEEPLYISNERFKELSEKFGKPKKNDILITAVGTIGKIYRVSEDWDFYFKDGNLLWLRDIKNETYSKFLEAYFKSDRFQRQLFNISGGSSQKALTINKLEALEIPSFSADEMNHLIHWYKNSISIRKTLSRKKDECISIRNGIISSL